MATTIFGLNDVVQTRISKGISKNGTLTLGEVWRGPPGKAEAKYNIFVNQHGIDNVNVVTEKGISVITVDSASDTIPGSPQDVWAWNLVGSDLTKPLESFGGLPEVPGSLRFNLDEDQKGIAEVLRQHSMGALNYSPVVQPMNRFAAIHRRGTTEYLRSGITLQASKIVSSRSVSLFMSWNGVDRAHIMGSADGGPVGVWDDMLISMAQHPEYDATMKQWLKRAPTSNTTDGRFYELHHTWIWARRWSHTLYNGDFVADGSNP